MSPPSSCSVTEVADTVASYFGVVVKFIPDASRHVESPDPRRIFAKGFPRFPRQTTPIAPDAFLSETPDDRGMGEIESLYKRAN
jgi:hypothetical protein